MKVETDIITNIGFAEIFVIMSVEAFRTDVIEIFVIMSVEAFRTDVIEIFVIMSVEAFRTDVIVFINDVITCFTSD